MKKFSVVLPDELVALLEESFAPEEIPIIVNQAVLRQIDEWYKQFGIKPDGIKDGGKNPVSVPNGDENAHEWTR